MLDQRVPYTAKEGPRSTKGYQPPTHQRFVGRLVETDGPVLWPLPLAPLDVPVVIGLRVPGGVELGHRGLVATGTDDVVDGHELLHVRVTERGV